MSCLDKGDEEIVQHLLCECPALRNRTLIHLGMQLFHQILANDIKFIKLVMTEIIKIDFDRH